MITEVRFALDLESAHFLSDLYFRQMESGDIEVGIMKRDGRDYAWAVIPPEQFKKLQQLMIPENEDAPRT